MGFIFAKININWKGWDFGVYDSAKAKKWDKRPSKTTHSVRGFLKYSNGAFTDKIFVSMYLCRC